MCVPCLRCQRLAAVQMRLGQGRSERAGVCVCRDDRKQSRLKYLVHEWGIAKFRGVVRAVPGQADAALPVSTPARRQLLYGSAGSWGWCGCAAGTFWMLPSGVPAKLHALGLPGTR